MKYLISVPAIVDGNILRTMQGEYETEKEALDHVASFKDLSADHLPPSHALTGDHRYPGELFQLLIIDTEKIEAVNQFIVTEERKLIKLK